MRIKRAHIHVGLRTAKTAAAVIIAMLLVDSYGATPSKLIFAMLGAMAAVQPTFQDSLESCLTQIVGVLFGGLTGILLRFLPIPQVLIAGIGIVVVITAYNTLRIRFSPGVPCLIVVILCTTPDIQPMNYALGRIWDSAIGLGVGLLINMLIFPYDNSRRIRSTAESLEQEVIRFLEEMFDGDDNIPNPDKMAATIDDMERQMKIFSNQRLFLGLRRQHRELEAFRICDGKARELVARMEVLSHMERPGRLNEENRRRLQACGANIGDARQMTFVTERDVVTNYHVRQILSLRCDLLKVLQI